MGRNPKPQKRRATGVRAAWMGLLDALRGRGWEVTEVRRAGYRQARYNSGGRIGTLFLFDRGDSVWRMVVDGIIWTARSVKIVPVRPVSYTYTSSAHEITFMLSEMRPVCEWLARWLLAYDSGGGMPDMPDGTPYSGGYQWTKARTVADAIIHRRVYRG